MEAGEKLLKFTFKKVLVFMVYKHWNNVREKKEKIKDLSLACSLNVIP